MTWFELSSNDRMDLSSESLKFDDTIVSQIDSIPWAKALIMLKITDMLRNSWGDWNINSAMEQSFWESMDLNTAQIVDLYVKLYIEWLSDNDVNNMIDKHWVYELAKQEWMDINFSLLDKVGKWELLAELSLLSILEVNELSEQIVVLQWELDSLFPSLRDVPVEERQAFFSEMRTARTEKDHAVHGVVWETKGELRFIDWLIWPDWKII